MESAFTLNEEGAPVFSDLLENLRNNKSGLSKKAAEGADSFLKLFDTLAGCFDENKALSDFIERVIRDAGLDEYHRAGDEIEGTTRVQNLQELVNTAVPYKCTMEGLLQFLDAINLDRTLDAENQAVGDNAVTLITLHNTKGLEYNRVIITGLEEGVFPRLEKAGAELEEERRLFYVGITRARNELYVTSTAKRCLYGRWDFMRPSPFIKEAAEAFTVIGQAPFGFGKKGGGFGGGLSDLGGVDDELASKWKKGTRVFHDDYGYGAVVAAYSNSGEFVIEVAFENGGKKKFLPKYQSKSLEIIKD
jgi:DNA helicase-2/ATP-dependent DNA helicase PcrA